MVELQEQFVQAVSKKDEAATKSFQSPLAYSSCQLAETDIDVWQKNCDRLTQDPKSVQGLRRIARDTPKPLGQAALDALAEHAQPDDAVAREDTPPWVRVVAQLRDQMRPCALKLRSEEGGPVLAKVLFCKQRNPIE
eukprot:6670394-Lingulodinium_polyedra.AAC.1